MYRLCHFTETVNVSFSLPINDRHALFDARLGIAPHMITQRVQPRRQDQGRWHSRLVAKKRRSAPALQLRPVTGIEPFKVRTLPDIAPPAQLPHGITGLEVHPRQYWKWRPRSERAPGGEGACQYEKIAVV